MELTTHNDDIELATKLNDVISLQEELNVNTNGDNWKSGETKDGRIIDWQLCMMLEASEAIDSLNWKHWKDKDKSDDMNNFRMELTDIFHFLLSESILKNTNGVLLPIISNIINVDKRVLDRNELIAYLKQFVYWIIYSDSDMEDAHDGFIKAINTFFYIVHNTEEFSFEELYRLYLGKNLLNTFRQNNGYDEGTYKKVFGEVGKEVEDNVWLMQYLNTANDISYNATMNYLDDVYAKYTK